MDEIKRYGISPIQKQFWLQHQSDPQSAAYNMASLFELSAMPDRARIIDVLGALIRRHSILRTLYGMEKGRLIARILEDMAPDFREDNYSQELLSQDIEEPFDLSKGPLFRTRLYKREKGYFLLFVFHHIAIDLRSKDIFGSEFSLLYNRGANDSPIGESTPYEEYPGYLEKERSTDRWEKMASFWKGEIGGLSPLLLTYDGERPPAMTTEGTRRTGALDPSLFADLNRYCIRSDRDPFLILLALYGVILHKYSGQTRISIGVPRTNRESGMYDNTMGCFVNILPLVLDINPQDTISDVLGQVRKKMLLIHRNQYFPYTDVVSLSPHPSDRKYNPLFQVGFTNEYPMTISLDGLTAEPLPVPGHGSQLDLFLYFWQRNGVFHWELEYNSRLFHKRRIDFFIDAYGVLLRDFLSGKDLPMDGISLVSRRTEQLILQEWQGDTRPLSGGLCIHGLVEKQAALSGGKTALIFKGNELSFEMLNARANDVAALLIGKGIGREAIVGVSLERSFEMVIALLGILKAGAAYLPMEPTHPSEYKKYLIEDSGLSVILTKGRYRGELSALGYPIELICLDEIAQGGTHANPADRVGPENRAYVFYTSGSTGKPKGVDILHEGLLDRILWMDRIFRFGTERRTILKTPYNFDVSGMEFWLPLITGAPLVIAEPGGHLDNAYLARTMGEEKISISHFVPSLLKTFLKSADSRKCPDLRDVLCCGEALPPEVVNEFYEKFPEARLHNLYGPTEATIFITYWNCERNVKQVPIGRPVSNTECYILDSKGQLLPPGVTGELYLGGIGLARGYMNRPDLTEKAFVEQPWNRDKLMYKTGDLTQWTPEGEILYLGRNDNQVQLHGQRVELGEIENALNSHPCVEGAALKVTSDFGAEQRLVAYIVKKGDVTSRELASHIEKTLPKYMIPSFFVFLDKFELNSNGKLDRKKLPEPSVMGDESSLDIVEPKTDKEKAIALIWEKILGRPVGRGQTFFELGGSSLQLMELQQELALSMGQDVPIAILFEYTTLEKLGEYFEGDSGATKREEKVMSRAERQRLSARKHRRN